MTCLPLNFSGIVQIKCAVILKYTLTSYLNFLGSQSLVKKSEFHPFLLVLIAHKAPTLFFLVDLLSIALQLLSCLEPNTPSALEYTVSQIRSSNSPLDVIPT